MREASGAGPLLREARVPADSFVRGALLPPRMQRQVLSSIRRTDAAVLHLRDTQARIEANLTHPSTR